MHTNRGETGIKTQELSAQLRVTNTKLSQHQRLNLSTTFQGERSLGGLVESQAGVMPTLKSRLMHQHQDHRSYYI